MNVVLLMYCFLSRRASDLDQCATERTNPLNLVLKAYVSDRTDISNRVKTLNPPGNDSKVVMPSVRRQKLIDPMILTVDLARTLSGKLRYTLTERYRTSHIIARAILQRIITAKRKLDLGMRMILIRIHPH